MKSKNPRERRERFAKRFQHFATVLSFLVLALLFVSCWLVGQSTSRTHNQPKAVKVHPAPAIVTPAPPADWIAPQARSAQSAPQLPMLWSATFATTGITHLAATPYLQNMDALRALPATLAPEQFELLRDLLALPFDPNGSMELLEFNGVKNVAADLLLRQPDFPADLAFDFCAMFADEAYDVVWRDYCLQMAVGCGLALSQRDHDDNETTAALGIILHTLRAATGMADHSWPGTALFGLNTLHRSGYDAVTATEVETLALNMALNENGSEAARISALRVCGEHKLAACAAVARSLAQNGATESLRCAAIATLGDLALPEDIALLERLSHTHDPFLAKVAQTARARIATTEEWTP